MKTHRLSLRSRKHARGFTLFEIMIVVGIIIVLAGATVYKLRGNLDVAKKQRVNSDINAIITQLRTYDLNSLSLPTTEQGLDALVRKPSTPPVPRRWDQLMSEVPLDPWGTPYVYKNPGSRNSSGFDLYSLGPDKKESEDDIGNWDEP